MCDAFYVRARQVGWHDGVADVVCALRTRPSGLLCLALLSRFQRDGGSVGSTWRRCATLFWDALQAAVSDGDNWYACRCWMVHRGCCFESIFENTWRDSVQWLVTPSVAVLLPEAAVASHVPSGQWQQVAGSGLDVGGSSFIISNDLRRSGPPTIGPT
jgi:hypothetical protein